MGSFEPHYTRLYRHTSSYSNEQAEVVRNKLETKCRNKQFHEDSSRNSNSPPNPGTCSAYALLYWRSWCRTLGCAARTWAKLSDVASGEFRSPNVAAAKPQPRQKQPTAEQWRFQAVRTWKMCDNMEIQCQIEFSDTSIGERLEPECQRVSPSLK